MQYVTLASLVSLSLAARPHSRGLNADAAILWNHIRVPALRELSLHGLGSDEVGDLAATIYNRSVRGGQLGQLSSLQLDKIDGRMIAPLISACRDLVELILTGPEIRFVLDFVLKMDRQCVSTGALSWWPHLRCLQIASTEDQLISAFVLTRKAVGCPMVELRLDRGLLTDTVAWLRERVEVVSVHDHIPCDTQTRYGGNAHMLNRV